MTFAFLAMGSQLFFYPAMLGNSMFRYLTAIGAGEHLAIVFLLVGAFRFAALVSNGVWPMVGPLIRAVCAALGAAIWLEMGSALVHASMEEPQLRPVSIPLYIVLALAELVSCYRAASDARTRHQQVG